MTIRQAVHPVYHWRDLSGSRTIRTQSPGARRWPTIRSEHKPEDPTILQLESSNSRMAYRINPLAVAFLLASGAVAQQQVNAPDFNPQVEHPAFTKKHPRIGIDESHRNFHTRDGRYKPFAALMESDGFEVSAAPHFDARSLKAVHILVTANAMGDFLDSTTGGVRNGATGPAFTPTECDTVRDCVRRGGSLLLIADHVPWGDASAILPRRFGVEMGLGIVMNLKHAGGNPTRLVFSVDNGLLGEHPILRSRSPTE